MYKSNTINKNISFGFQKDIFVSMEKCKNIKVFDKNNAVPSSECTLNFNM